MGGEWSSTGGEAGFATRPVTGSFRFCYLPSFQLANFKDLKSIPKPSMADLTVTYSGNIMISLNDVRIKCFLLENLSGILSTKIIFMTINMFLVRCGNE